MLVLHLLMDSFAKYGNRDSWDVKSYVLLCGNVVKLDDCIVDCYIVDYLVLCSKCFIFMFRE